MEISSKKYNGEAGRPKGKDHKGSCQIRGMRKIPHVLWSLCSNEMLLLAHAPKDPCCSKCIVFVSLQVKATAIHYTFFFIFLIPNIPYNACATYNSREDYKE